MAYTDHDTIEQSAAFSIGGEFYGFVDCNRDGDPNQNFTILMVGPVGEFEVPVNNVVAGWSILVVLNLILFAALGMFVRHRRRPLA